MNIKSGNKNPINTGVNATAINAKSEESSGKSPISYYKKNVYGNEMNYIHDAHVANAHHELTGQTTLSNRHIEAYKALGHKVNHVPKN